MLTDVRLGHVSREETHEKWLLWKHADPHFPFSICADQPAIVRRHGQGCDNARKVSQEQMRLIHCSITCGI